MPLPHPKTQTNMCPYTSASGVNWGKLDGLSESVHSLYNTKGAKVNDSSK